MRVMNEHHPSRPLPDWPFASPYGTLMPKTQTSERERERKGTPFGVMPLVCWRGREEAQVKLMTSLVENACLNSIERLGICSLNLLNHCYLEHLFVCFSNIQPILLQTHHN